MSTSKFLSFIGSFKQDLCYLDFIAARIICIAETGKIETMLLQQRVNCLQMSSPHADYAEGVVDGNLIFSAHLDVG